MCVLTINMHNPSVYVIFLAAFANIAWTEEGLKGAPRPSYRGIVNYIPNTISEERLPSGAEGDASAQNHSLPYINNQDVSPGQNANLEEGLCYKRVLHILALNASGGLPNDRLPTLKAEATPDSQEWITVLDCCNGYQRSVITGKCHPQCREGCLGGRCSAPEVCICQAGWRVEKGVCVPICNRPCQKNAYCFSPDVCVCKFGYQKVQDQCHPVCAAGCKNGECVTPDTCECRSGFERNVHHECVPVCEGGCPHGACNSPGICRCNNGYVNPAGRKESCVPHCPDGCNGGECISPGICNCTADYTRDPRGRCILTTPKNQSFVCVDGCGEHGTCIGPNLCACEKGFRIELDTGKCIRNDTTHDNIQPPPVCDRPCRNGNCTGPNKCTCKSGYAMDPKDRSHTICVPVCDRPCRNGGCTEPNKCTCKSGYAMDLKDETHTSCLPVCDPPCKNGDCTGPNKCSCKSGYAMDPKHQTQTICNPVCELPCKNGDCTGPNQCICKVGYAMDPKDQTRTKCGPICFDECINSECTAPGVCTCKPGYIKYVHLYGNYKCASDNVFLHIFDFKEEVFKKVVDGIF